jgi:hypothetical protein
MSADASADDHGWVEERVATRRPVEVVIEYGLGFGFGWTIFQALFMRDRAGGSYRRALATTFLPRGSSTG